jgi:hypothetical protein
MTTAIAEPGIETPPADAFEIHEAVASAGTSFNSDGTIDFHIIRPCLGKGKGRHLYRADMLRENAHKFTGWKMYADHRSEAARRAAAGLPRSIRDLAGRILETRWDGGVPADPVHGYEQGAVVARVRPVGFVRQLLEEDPGLVDVSISARATSVQRVRHGDADAWAVEGIEDKGSVDFVTEGGAGGRVAALLEAAYNNEKDEEMALLESMTDDQLLAHVRERRPALLKALGTAEHEGGDAPAGRGGEMGDTPKPVDVLREALGSEEGRELINGLVKTRVDEELKEEREQLREAGELARAEARADADRQVQLRDLRDLARKQITEAELPKKFEADLAARFDLVEGRPTPELNVFDETDAESGEVSRSASVVLREAVEEAVRHSRDLIAAAGGGTRVEGQGGGGDGGDGGERKSKSALWRRSLSEAGYEKPDEVYEEAGVPVGAGS